MNTEQTSKKVFTYTKRQIFKFNLISEVNASRTHLIKVENDQ